MLNGQHQITLANKASYHTSRFILAVAMFIFLAMIIHTQNAHAQLAPTSKPSAPISRIAAIVNEDIISQHDLTSRVRLAMLSAGMENTAANYKKLVRQILRHLIDESLQRAEAKANNIRVSASDITRQLVSIAKRNKSTVEKMQQIFNARGIDIESLKSQLEAQSLWSKFVARRLNRKVSIGEDEIAEELDRLKANLNVPQKRVFEIFLGITDPDQAPTVKRNADRLYAQLREGANFSALARSFSQSNTASVGGDIGWVSPGQLPEELDLIIEKMVAGQVSSVTRTLRGYHIIFVAKTRSLGADPSKTKLNLIQTSVPLDGNNNLQNLTSYAVKLKSCKDASTLGEAAGYTITSLDNIAVGDLSKMIATAVAPLKIDQTTAPITAGENLMLFTLCKRVKDRGHLPTRKEIKNRLGQARLDLAAARHIRDLRSAAFIDVRL